MLTTALNTHSQSGASIGQRDGKKVRCYDNNTHTGYGCPASGRDGAISDMDARREKMILNYPNQLVIVANFQDLDRCNPL